jgi:hypothetical protein
MGQGVRSTKKVVAIYVVDNSNLVARVSLGRGHKLQQSCWRFLPITGNGPGRFTILGTLGESVGPIQDYQEGRVLYMRIFEFLWSNAFLPPRIVSARSLARPV